MNETIPAIPANQVTESNQMGQLMYPGQGQTPITQRPSRTPPTQMAMSSHSSFEQYMMDHQAMAQQQIQSFYDTNADSLSHPPSQALPIQAPMRQSQPSSSFPPYSARGMPDVMVTATPVDFYQDSMQSLTVGTHQQLEPNHFGTRNSDSSIPAASTMSQLFSTGVSASRSISTSFSTNGRLPTDVTESQSMPSLISGRTDPATSFMPAVQALRPSEIVQELENLDEFGSSGSILSPPELATDTSTTEHATPSVSSPQAAGLLGSQDDVGQLVAHDLFVSFDDSWSPYLDEQQWDTDLK